MKKIIVLLSLVLLSSFTSNAQSSKIHPHLKSRIQKAARSGDAVDIFVRGDKATIAAITQANGGAIRYQIDGVTVVRIPLNAVQTLANESKVKYIHDANARIYPLSDRMLYNNNVHPVHQGNSPLSKEYTGKGVIVGIIDSGVEIDHPDFQKDNGDSRIIYIWDQVNAGSPPSDYGYGNECSNSEINSGSCTHDGQAFGAGHGSNVTGISAGDGSAVNNFKGVAPEADILVVSLDFDNNFLLSFVDAVEYLCKKADQLGKQIVINASVGSMYGTRDGRDDIAQLVDSIITAKDGRILVNAAGNSGKIEFHLGQEVTSDTSFTWFEWMNDPLGIDTDGVYFNLIADTADFNLVNYSFTADDPNNWASRGTSNWQDISSALNQYHYEYVMNGADTVGTIRTLASLLDYDSTSYILETRIFTDSTHLLWRFSSTGQGGFDVWSGEDKTYASWTSNMVDGASIPDQVTFPPIANYSAPDNLQTMVSTWNCLPNVISVANYNNRSSWYDYNSSLQTNNNIVGDLGPTSSHGPTRTGYTKPEISATGNATFACSRFESLFAGIPSNNIALGGMHNINGGTSMAAPVVTGAVALYMQKVLEEDGRFVTIAEVKHLLKQTARQDQFTGSNLPNEGWGHGKLDVFEMLSYPIIVGCTDPSSFNYDPNANVSDGSCIPFIYGCTNSDAGNYDPAANTDDGSCWSVGIPNSSNAMVKINPNPAQDFITVNFNLTGPDINIEIYNLHGQLLRRSDNNPGQNAVGIDVSDMPPGLYICHLSQRGSFITSERFVLNK